MQGFISVNGAISLPEAASIPALDRGFLFGDSVFETMVGFGNKILDVEPHLERLRKSAQDLHIEIPWSNADLAFELESICAQLNGPKKSFRLVISRGNGLGLGISSDMQPNRMIYALEAPTESEAKYAKGINVKRKVLPFTIRGASAKTGQNYLRSILAIKESGKEGFDDVLWTNSSGELTECSTANIFLIGRDGDLVEVATPAEASGILLGITRSTLIQLLTKSKIKVTERMIYSDEIPRFDEAFICSTVRGLMPISRIDNHQLHTCRESSVFRHFQRLYLSWIESQLGYRVDWNSGRKV